MTEINSLDIEKALKFYNAVKKANTKYSHSDKGKERRRAASATYYQKMKLIDTLQIIVADLDQHQS